MLQAFNHITSKTIILVAELERANVAADAAKKILADANHHIEKISLELKKVENERDEARLGPFDYRNLHAKLDSLLQQAPRIAAQQSFSPHSKSQNTKNPALDEMQLRLIERIEGIKRDAQDDRTKRDTAYSEQMHFLNRLVWLSTATLALCVLTTFAFNYYYNKKSLEKIIETSQAMIRQSAVSSHIDQQPPPQLAPTAVKARHGGAPPPTADGH